MSSIDASIQFSRLLSIMASLRAPDGCPWDREQTVDTLKKYVLEETYELLEAIDRHDHRAICEELGDFLLQAVFIAQLEAEDGRFSMADVAQGIADKLVRRHPHVFGRDAGEAPLDTAGQVRTKWEEIKAAERQGAETPKTLLSGLPAALPALLRAHHIGSRAASVGFEWHTTDDVVAKIREEVDEVQEALAAGPANAAHLEEEVGDLLFAIANLSRRLGVEPETALRKANDKFTRRFTAMETQIVAEGRQVGDFPLEALEERWQMVKKTGHEGTKPRNSP